MTWAGQKQPLAPNSAVKPCVQQEHKNKNYKKKRKFSLTLENLAYTIYNIIEYV